MTLLLQSRLRQENTHHDKHCLYSNVSLLDDIPQPQHHQCQYIICIHNSSFENTGKIFESQWGRFLLLIIWNGCLLCVLFKQQLSSPTPRRKIQGADVHAVELEYSWQQTISHMYIKIYFLNLVNWNSQIGTCDSAIKSYDFTRRWRNPVKITWINYQTRPDWFQPWYHPPSLPSKFQVAKF